MASGCHSTELMHGNFSKSLRLVSYSSSRCFNVDMCNRTGGSSSKALEHGNYAIFIYMFVPFHSSTISGVGQIFLFHGI